MDRRKYPRNWEAFSRRIRFVRAGGRCECAGECGLHRTTPGPRRCAERHGEPARWAKGKVILTVAHMNNDGPCSCDPRCAIDAHVKAMCQRCHLRYDRDRHARNARNGRDRKAGRVDLFEK